MRSKGIAIPYVVWMAIFVVVPLILVVVYAFTNRSGGFTLENFASMPVSPKAVILGDMRELGAESAAEHQKIADYIKECDFEEVWLVGEQFAAAEHSFKTYPNAQEVIKELETNKPKGYTILIKGSNGIRLSSTVDHL